MLKMIMANNNGWKWSLLLNSLDAVATADVLTANNNDLNIDETRTIHFAWLFKNRRLVLKEQTNSTAIPHVGKLNHLFAAWKAEIPRDIVFIQSTPKDIQRWRVSWIRSIKERKLLQKTKKRSDNGNEVASPNSVPGFSPTRSCGSEWKTTLGTRLFAPRVWLLADYLLCEETFRTEKIRIVFETSKPKIVWWQFLFWKKLSALETIDSYRAFTSDTTCIW